MIKLHLSVQLAKMGMLLVRMDNAVNAFLQIVRLVQLIKLFAPNVMLDIK